MGAVLIQEAANSFLSHKKFCPELVNSSNDVIRVTCYHPSKTQMEVLPFRKPIYRGK